MYPSGAVVGSKMIASTFSICRLSARSMPVNCAPSTCSNRSPVRRRVNVFLEPALPRQCVRPVEPVGDGGEPPPAFQIGHLADADHRVLHVRRHDIQILGIEDDEL